MIKTALMLERGFILPNYDFKYPNENIPFDDWGLKVAARQQPWPFGKRWASVNGFGFGGTNGHVVVSIQSPFSRQEMPCADHFVVVVDDKGPTRAKDNERRSRHPNLRAPVHPIRKR